MVVVIVITKVVVVVGISSNVRSRRLPVAGFLERGRNIE